MPDLSSDVGADPEDVKLLTLARAIRARTRAAQGAAIRDLDGRTYSAVEVHLPSLQLTALQVAVAMAASSGVSGLEAAVVVSEAPLEPERDLATVRDFAGGGRLIHRANAAGVVVDTVTT
ncbi:MAG: cytidine deaminase [Nocardioidaceae bacterium]